jgi:hypothetical protein
MWASGRKLGKGVNRGGTTNPVPMVARGRPRVWAATAAVGACSHTSRSVRWPRRMARQALILAARAAGSPKPVLWSRLA